MTGETAGGWRSRLYAGSVFHRRLRPRRHELRYGVFYMLLDLDELDGLDRDLPDLRITALRRCRFTIGTMAGGTTVPCGSGSRVSCNAQGYP